MPWKNGGGVTTEVAVSPADAGLNDFDWRVSMARVEGSGPFSQFAGIDRTLAVLEGEGIVLDIAGRPPISVTRATDPLSFPADVSTAAALIGGPITDLNVMTRRGRFSHRVERKSENILIEPPTICETVFVLAMGTISLETEGEVVVLDALDAALIETQTQVITGHAAFYLISLRTL